MVRRAVRRQESMTTAVPYVAAPHEIQSGPLRLTGAGQWRRAPVAYVCMAVSPYIRGICRRRPDTPIGFGYGVGTRWSVHATVVPLEKHSMPRGEAKEAPEDS